MTDATPAPAPFPLTPTDPPSRHQSRATPGLSGRGMSLKRCSRI
jgi:hypothetical protein